MSFDNGVLPMECIVLAEAGTDKRISNAIWQAELYEDAGCEYFRGTIVKFFPDVAIVRFKRNVILPVGYQYIRFRVTGELLRRK